MTFAELIVQGALGDLVFKDFRLGTIVQRARFLWLALQHNGLVKRLLDAPSASTFAGVVARRPELFGALIWPYQCIRWSASARLERIRDHYECIDRFCPKLSDFVQKGGLLLSLDDIRPDLKIVIDQPVWFLREGELSINIFNSSTRLFTLAFSFTMQEGELKAFVGALQGRSLEGALDEYRELTKQAHGMRPRDLLLEVFRIFCATMSVKQIFAVADECRIHRSEYFAGRAIQKIHSNYNDAWEDRGGRRIDPDVYELPLCQQRKNLAEISAKKRALYRKRYQWLDSLEQRVAGVMAAYRH